MSKRVGHVTDFNKLLLMGADGLEYKAEIEVYESANEEMFPEGVSATFLLFRLNKGGEKELVLLIDNHKPYGFHLHDEMPYKPEKRVLIETMSWQEAWKIFQKKCKRYLK